MASKQTEYGNDNQVRCQRLEESEKLERSVVPISSINTPSDDSRDDGLRRGKTWRQSSCLAQPERRRDSLTPPSHTLTPIYALCPHPVALRQTESRACGSIIFSCTHYIRRSISSFCRFCSLAFSYLPNQRFPRLLSNPPLSNYNRFSYRQGVNLSQRRS